MGHLDVGIEAQFQQDQINQHARAGAFEQLDDRDLNAKFQLQPGDTFDLVLALFIFYIDIVVLQYKNYELIMGCLLVSTIAFMAVMGAIAKKKGKAY